MRLTKRQLKRIIREEYSRLKRRGLIKESMGSSSMSGRRRALGMSGNQGGPQGVLQFCKNLRSGASSSHFMGMDNMAQLETGAQRLAQEVERGRFTMDDLFEAEEMCYDDEFCFAIIEMCLSDYL